MLLYLLSLPFMLTFKLTLKGYYLLRQLIFAVFGKSQNLVAVVISTRKSYPVLQFSKEKTIGRLLYVELMSMWSTRGKVVPA